MSPKLVFIHIPKSAGSSFRLAIEQNFKPNQIFSFYWYLQNAKRVEKCRTLIRRNYPIKLIVGHLGYGIHERIDSDVEYITMLRDPVQRVISHYYHILWKKKHQLHNEVRKMTLKEYVSSDIDESVTNSQTRFISSSKFYYEMREEDDTRGSLPFDSEEKMFEDAKANLSKIAFCGITERFDESLVLLKELLPLKNVFYCRLNKSSNKPKNDPDKDTLEYIASRNELDLKLYKYAQRLFDEKINQIDGFDEKVSHFRKINSRVGRYYGYKTKILYEITKKVGLLKAY